MGYFAIRRMRERLQGAAPELPREGAPTPEGPAGTPLPEGFPARSLLLAHGYATLEAVREATDEALLGVKGIGPKLLAEIRDALRQQG